MALRNLHLRAIPFRYAGYSGLALIILALEVNAIVGKPGPMASVGGVIGCSIGLTVVLYALMSLL